MHTNIAPIQVMEHTEEPKTSLLPDISPFPFAITENTVIGQLPTFCYHIEDQTFVQQVEKTLRASPDLPGVIVTKNNSILGVISRRRFFEVLGTRYGVAVFSKRPVHVMLKHFAAPLTLPSTYTIQEAVHLALKRENTLVYEPILVKCTVNGFQLLDIYTLILAQSQLFAALQKELQLVNVELENRVERRTKQLTQANSHLNQEITERKQAETHLKVRVRYERAVAQAADSLLAAVDKPEVIPETLQQLLHAAKVSRVYLSEYVDIEGRGPCLRLLHEVCAPNVAPIPEKHQVLAQKEYQVWIDDLWTGKSLIGHANSTNGIERVLLDQLGIQSYLLLPVGKPGDWYGMIGLDETAVSRDWSPNDIQLFQTIARMLYTYIARTRSRAALREAKESAEKANQFKTELMAKVNHELRTPLGAIIGYAQLLQFGSYGPVSEEQQDPLKLIISSSNYLNTLVSSLLDQARLEKGKLTLETLPYKITEFVSEVESRTCILAEKTGLEFKIFIEPDFPDTLVGDKTRIQQIWTNLLSNAIKFTEEGYIHTCIRQHGNEQWSIEVSDTGRGIPKEAQPYIFDAFVQADGSPTRQRSGTGLGLSIAASIIEMMGGQIDLQSDLDKGTTFTVILPMKTELAE